MAQDFVVFIIDDDESVRDSLRDLLEAHQYRVDSYRSGREFLRRAARRAPGRGCLLIDYDLPEVDGFEVLRRLAAAGQPLPAIVITGRADPRLRGRAAQAGALAFLEKPFRYDTLLALIESIEQSGHGPAPA